MCSTRTKDIDWKLCCLCQSIKDDVLQTPTEQGLITLEKDLTDFKQLNALPTGVNISNIDDGSGVASTLLSRAAVYHKSCRSSCNNYRFKRLRDSLERQGEKAAVYSPKKLRSSFEACSENVSCIICEGEDPNDLRKTSTSNVDEHLKNWAKTTKNWRLFSRLSEHSDVHAMDAYYHVQCYRRLRDASRAADRRDVPVDKTLPFDPMVTAQLVTFVDESRSEVYKLSVLREMYQKMMSDLGRPCSGREPHATRFKEHMLLHLPDWDTFNQGRDVYLSHRETVGNVLAEAYKSSQIDQDEALLLIRAAIFLRKCILTKQDTFKGSFSANCLTSPVDEAVLSFMNVVLQGPKGNLDNYRSAHDRSDASLGARAKIACTLKYASTKAPKFVITGIVKHHFPFTMLLNYMEMLDSNTRLRMPIVLGFLFHMIE